MLQRLRCSTLVVLHIIIIAAFGLPCLASSQPLHICERVIDGDTIILEDIGRVRLIGVDTPETVHRSKPVERFGKEASEFLRGLIEGGKVWLEYDWQRKDKYGRTLAYVYLPDSTFVNAAIIRFGYGHAYTKYPFKYEEEFRELEREAREAKRGLWAAGPADLSAKTGPASPGGESGEITVYATRTGTKYHRKGCRYLARSMIPISLRDAVQRYGPCSVCSPPTLSEVPSSSRTTYKSRPPSTSKRCQAITKKGTQCKRNAKAGSSYCWQHSG